MNEENGMQILDGKKLAEQMQRDLVDKVSRLQQDSGITPGLVVILVGEDSASQIYVNNKQKAALKAGFTSHVERLPETISQEELVAIIHKYNKDDNYHGILVQLPLPKHLDEQLVLQAVDYRKDVDGFHPYNVGQLFLGQGEIKPCTPYGIMRLLDANDISIEGKIAVIVGRSNIVGKPMAHLLLEQNATVIVAHSKTANLKEVTKQADILVVAVGRSRFITQEYVKSGAVVVDVGINRDENGKLCGDVCSSVAQIAAAVTPVPGGVGPMTITMLLEQTYALAKRTVN